MTKNNECYIRSNVRGQNSFVKNVGLLTLGSKDYNLSDHMTGLKNRQSEKKGCCFLPHSVLNMVLEVECLSSFKILVEVYTRPK